MREGPAVVQLPDGTWRIYLDAYTEGRYLYSDSTDAEHLVARAGASRPVRTVRHFGVIREPA